MAKTKNNQKEPTPQENYNDCVLEWKNKLDQTDNNLRTARATAECREKAYTNAKEWKEKLTKYCENIDKTDELYQEMEAERDQFVSQAEKVNTNTSLTVDAVNILLCDIQTILNCSFELKWMISQLQEKLKKKAGSQDKIDSSKLIACLDNAEQKRAAADLESVDSLLKAGETLKKSQTLCAATGEDGGILYQLDHIDQLFVSPDFTFPTNWPAGNHSCKGEINPKPVFSLSDKMNEYYKNTKKQLGMAKTELTTAEAEYLDARKKRDALESAQISLNNAITAAENAKDCK